MGLRATPEAMAALATATGTVEIRRGSNPGVGGVVVRVAAERADEARRIIEEYRASAENDASDDELTAEGETEEPA